MNEIGEPRTVTVRTVSVVNGKRKLVPKTANGVPETKTVHAEVWRVTRNELDGTFGRDRGRRLVVGLVSPDLLVLSPKGTRQQVTVPLDEVYRIALKRKADQAFMAKLRERKAKKQEQRERRRLDAAERRLRRPVEDSWSNYAR